MATIRIALLALLFACLASAAQAKRLALVIGNDSYQNVQQLKNARADAKAIAAGRRQTHADYQ